MATGVPTIIVFAFYQTKAWRSGPIIKIAEPKGGQIFYSAPVVIKGSIENVSHLFLNGRKIFADKDGNFTEQILLQYGYNVITVEGQDRFGKKAEEKISVMFD